MQDCYRFFLNLPIFVKFSDLFSVYPVFLFFRLFLYMIIVVYTMICVICLCLVLTTQVIFISQNLTSREYINVMRGAAHLNGWTSTKKPDDNDRAQLVTDKEPMIKMMFFVTGNPNNRGLITNWKRFLMHNHRMVARDVSDNIDV